MKYKYRSVHTFNNSAYLLSAVQNNTSLFITDGLRRIPIILEQVYKDCEFPFAKLSFSGTADLFSIDYVRANDPIKKVIYNPPNAVIVFWIDGTKTVVKCSENDVWDPEKGLAMAVAKKFLGNEGNYNNILKRHLPKEEA